MAPGETMDANQALFEYALRMGDNCLVLGHRVSEWCGHAPALEEDIALANTALDLIGQTQMWLGLAGEIEGKGRTADDLAYKRDARAFRNVLLVERPNGDFGHTLVRQLFFDLWHFHTLGALLGSSDTRVAEIAEKSRKEVSYHLQRSADLVVRLGDGTAESRARMQAAVDALWPYTGELFMEDAVDETLAEAGIGPALGVVKPAFDREIAGVLKDATLKAPEKAWMHKGGKAGVHTEALGYVLAEMQFLQRAYPGATW